MINITVTDKKLIDQNVDCYVFGLEEGFVVSRFSPSLKDFTKYLCPELPDFLQESNFKGSLLDTRILPIMADGKLIHVLFVGLGKRGAKKVIDIEYYRRALGQAYRQAVAHKCTSLALTLPPASLFGVTPQYLTKQIALIFNMAAYHFNEYITQESQKKTEISNITLCVETKNKQVAQNGVKTGEYIATGVNKARHWIDLPPVELTPVNLAQKAQAIAKKSGLKITIFNEKQINDMGMGGLAAVSRGSDLECKLVILEYKAKKKTAPTLVFVGKGITFDSGGLSLKPPIHMETMKEDMSGAAAVIAAMEAIAALKPNVHVVGITPLAENLPSGKATKPGDIVRFYNGKTAEIRNTDAEGRLIMADALAYAVKHFQPAAIVDIATLTGACAYALGPFYTGLMSQHEDVVDQIKSAAQLAGDQVWRLPMHDDYKIAIKSSVADICNIGSQKYMAGAITAAHFLQNFVDDVPWAHLDIAGTAFNVPDIPYYRPGATGVGVRLFVELAMNWKG